MKPAKLLMAFQDEKGIFRFLTEENSPFTSEFLYTPKLALEGQIKSFLQEQFELSTTWSSRLKVHAHFREPLEEIAQGEALRLYLATLNAPFPGLTSEWRTRTFPELLSLLPKSRKRLPFLKAFQVLSDDKSDMIEAHELSRKELLEHIQKEKQPS